MSEDTEDQKHMPWDEGLPTAPDVTALQKKWPDLKVGDRIGYADICELLKIDWRSSRFRSVTSAWRKRELESGKVLTPDPGQAFYVASADQISAGTYGDLRSIGRKAKRRRRFLSTARTDYPVLGGIIAHQGKLMMHMEREEKKTRMNLLPSTTVSEQPRISPPVKAAKS